MTSSLAVDNTENNQNVIIRYEPMHNPKLWPDNSYLNSLCGLCKGAIIIFESCFPSKVRQACLHFTFLPAPLISTEPDKIVNACS